MELTWTAPAALWLLLAVPAIWIAVRWSRTRFNRRQRWLQAAVRSALLAALALALARPVASVSSSRASVVYVVDISHSIAGRGVEEAARRIDEINAALRPADSKILVFGAHAAAVRDTTALRRLADVGEETGAADPVDRGATDLEAALDAARGELAAGHIPRVVLFSDGQATSGAPLDAARRFAGAHIPVFTFPLGTRSIGDVWIDAIHVADRVPSGARFTVGVQIGSQHATAGTVELRADDRLVGRKEVAIAAGTTDVSIEAVIDGPGAHVLRAALVSPDDPLTENNSIDQAVWVDQRARVLYVEGTPASAHYLSTALSASGFDVTVRPPSALPDTSAKLDPYDAVIVSDVRRSAIPDAASTALADWVERGGGGLLVAGGEAVFGQHGYRKSPIERLTPVTFERRDEPEVALILVLDRSWSMAGSSMDLCKAAAQAALDVMSDEQSIGILTFNDGFDWDVTLRNVGKNRPDIRRKIAAIEPGGHTLIYPAVEQAYFALRSAKARAKHVILLSDGRSYPAEYEALVQKMVQARITVSSVAVGAFADNELLGNIAKWGKGRAYLAPDAKQLPEIFVKEARNAMTPAFDEDAVTPVVKAPAFLAGVDMTHAPRLKGRTATVLKDTALEVVATDNGDPLLAFWPIGLGRTAVFASDVKDRWGANWIKWPGYGPFFAAVVRAIERHRPPGLSLDLTPGLAHEGSRTVGLTVEARDEDGGYRDRLHPVVKVTAATRPPVELPLRQSGPGRYEATLVADAAEPVTVSIAGADPRTNAGVTSRAIIPDAAAEYRFRGTNRDLLQSMAAATGGAFMPAAQALAPKGGDRRIDRRPLWPAMIGLALCLWFVDVLLRRVRVFESHAQD